MQLQKSILLIQFAITLLLIPRTLYVILLYTVYLRITRQFLLIKLGFSLFPFGSLSLRSRGSPEVRVRLCSSLSRVRLCFSRCSLAVKLRFVSASSHSAFDRFYCFLWEKLTRLFCVFNLYATSSIIFFLFRGTQITSWANLNLNQS